MFGGFLWRKLVNPTKGSLLQQDALPAVRPVQALLVAFVRIFTKLVPNVGWEETVVAVAEV